MSEEPTVINYPNPNEPSVEEPMVEQEVVEERNPEYLPRELTIATMHGFVKLQPMVHPDLGHYGWQMSSVDHAVTHRAIEGGEEMKFAHDLTPAEFGRGDEDGVITFDGKPVSVYAA